MEGNVVALDGLLRRTRDKVRRERLHRQIGALETKLKLVCEQQRFNWRARAWKLNSKIKRLEWELRQPGLFL